jgi:hypothetical protein
MKVQIVGSFHKGDAVPEWLVEWLPTKGDANPGCLTFACDCHVIETSDGYTVVQDRFDDKYTLYVAGAKHMALSSPAVPVRLFTAWSTLYPEGDPRASNDRVTIVC